jgi:hypothetical protein
MTFSKASFGRGVWNIGLALAVVVPPISIASLTATTSLAQDGTEALGGQPPPGASPSERPIFSGNYTT